MTKRHRQLAAQRAELDGRRKAVIAEGRQISDTAEQEKRHLHPEEKLRRDSILSEAKSLKAEIDEVDSEIAAEVELEAAEKAEVAALVPTVITGNGTARVAYVRPAFNDEFRGLGEFLQGIAVCASPVMASRIPNAEALIAKMGVYQAAASGMSVGVLPDGGALVRTDWTSELLGKAREASVLMPLCRNVPVGGDFDALEYPFVDETSRATGSRWGGVQVYWKSEAEAVTASKPKLGRGNLQLEEIMGLAYATERLLRDASALENILQDAFSSEFAFIVDDSIIRGDGLGKPTGFFSPGNALVSIAKEVNQVAATVVTENVLKMLARIPPRLKAGAVWLIHPDVMTQLAVLKIGDQPVWQPPGQLSATPFGTLLGKPIYEVEQCEALGTKGDILCVNLGQYLLITKANEGLRYDTSMHVQFLTDQMAFRWVYRINGQPVWRSSVTAYKGSLAWSPYVSLDLRN